MRRYAFFAIVAIALSATPALAQKQKAVPFIDRVDQSSAAEVVEAFVAQMEADDYFGAYYLLSPTAKDGIYFALASGKLDTLLPEVDPFSPEGMVLGDRTAPAILQLDLSEGAQIFDDLMLGGLTTGHLPFRFEGANVVSLDTIEYSGTAVVEVEQGPSPLTLELQKTAWGEWRVHEITWDGAEDGNPWNATGATPLPAEEAPAEPRTYLDSLPTDTPETLAQAFVDAFAAHDYFKADLLMSPLAKSALFDQRQPLQIIQFLPGLDTTDVPGTGLYRDIPRADALSLDTMRDPALVMHRLLEAATRQGVLPFDLSGAEISETTAPAAPSEPENGVIAEAVVTLSGATPDEVQLQMVQLPNLEWRVDRVVWDGSLDWMRPWGVPVQ